MVTKIFFTQLLAMGTLFVILLALVGFSQTCRADIAKTADYIATATIFLAALLGVEAVIGALYLIWAA